MVFVTLETGGGGGGGGKMTIKHMSGKMLSSLCNFYQVLLAMVGHRKMIDELQPLLMTQESALSKLQKSFRASARPPCATLQILQEWNEVTPPVFVRVKQISVRIRTMRMTKTLDKRE